MVKSSRLRGEVNSRLVDLEPFRQLVTELNDFSFTCARLTPKPNRGISCPEFKRAEELIVSFAIVLRNGIIRE